MELSGDLRWARPVEIRMLCRRGVFSGTTAGLAAGFAQANLAVVPESAAAEFERFCLANPKPCPLIEVLEPGQFEPAQSARGADLRRDLPRYRVFRNGECVGRPTDIVDLWPDDASSMEPPEANELNGSARIDAAPPERLVAFLIGCSFTFETALVAAGLPVRHVELGCNVPMYRSGIETTAVGRFGGPLVVSMRPMTPEQADRAARITEGLPGAHGGPVHAGDPRALGIRELAQPDYGDPVPVRSGEVPVFWACGVTPLEAIMRAALALAITHEPGHMFITDLPA